MKRSSIDSCVAAALADRRLIDHPYYRRWDAGDISRAELASYAAQYRHFEVDLPGFLVRLQASLPEGPARELVSANLSDELGDPIPHTELFERFAAAVDAAAEAPSAAMTALIGTYDELLGQSPAAGLAGFLAYESQAAEISATKAAALRCHHRLDDDQVSFWEHHSAVDADHADWMADALSEVAISEEAVTTAARRAADVWWAFLDEREAARVA